MHEVSAYTTSLLTAEQFVTEAEDATALTFYFQNDPVLVEGTQEVVIVAKDEGGNTTEAVASLTLKDDTEAPVMKGVANRTVYIGDGISYKAGVTVTDNCDEDIELQVDSSGVDLNTEGNYHVTYSAKDRAGNETSQTITLTVRKHAYTQEEVDVLADKVLADIIMPEMSDYDKLVAIYDWVRTHVSYINYSEKVTGYGEPMKDWRCIRATAMCILPPQRSFSQEPALPTVILKNTHPVTSLLEPGRYRRRLVPF